MSRAEHARTLIITCEHGGNRIPAAYWPCFRPHRETLESHRGFDPGALALARDFAKALDAELVYATTSRLLVELNRSPRHPNLFSEVTRGLPTDERQALLERYYYPYRSWVETQVRAAIAAGRKVLHVSSHSFTPRLNGVVRRADVGLLYDPQRAGEVAFCLAWKAAIEKADGTLVVRRNYPYRGTGDGLTTHLRRRFAAKNYVGVEIEVNQKFPLGPARRWVVLRKALVTALERALHSGF